MKRPHRIGLLLAVCAALLAVFELGAGWMSARLRSRGSARDEVHAALALGGPGSVLVVGNSLVQHGIDLRAVSGALGPGYTTSKIAIVDTGYLDWLYGIASLFDRGSRPDAVVLAISPTQLVEDRTPTGAAARLVWTIPNLVRYTAEQRPGLTAASDLLFEHVSAFFAIRSRLRQDTRRAVVPGYEDMAREFLVSGKDNTPDTTRGERIGEARLRDLDAACARRGARFVYLVVPTTTPGDNALERAVVNAGRAAGVPVLVPVSNSDVDHSWLLDGYHLNAHGASMFSARVGQALAAELAAPRLTTRAY